ncbi:cytochrome oxidase assembly protein [Duganella sp. FT135W]|uniref:Cytochrome oxidase assembly protein n=1 Tax=Duganella flavida TaxID=2692175 RepID=A0A6L8K9G5_9BURK|nr:FixH family protein [Duganella flavida]MYM22868.1 cytochrome oxidase assembly protein [Duganella flavida]
MHTLNMPITPWWKQRWPWLLMAGPAIVIVASTYAGYLAVSAPDALAVGDYYKQGKAINQDLRRDHVASQLGLSVALGYDAITGTLSGRINRKDSGPLLLHLSHATLPEKDIKLVLVPDENGAFSARLPLLERSRWIVLVEGQKREWRLAGSWIYPAQRGVALLPD